MPVIRSIPPLNALLLIGAAVAFHAWAAAESPGQPGFGYSEYASVLDRFVSEDGLVDYEALKQNDDSLKRFIRRLGELSAERFGDWSEDRQIAFLINAYNAIALDLVVKHYPISPSPVGFFLWPNNSIRQIPGVFDRKTYTVMGREMTLDDIEHERLRIDYDEPRIHMALVCAAQSCPPLRKEPYTAQQLDKQLDSQTRRFLTRESNFRIAREKDVVYLSSIFKWFGDDFIDTHTPQRGFGENDKAERAVLHFLTGYLDESQREYLRRGAYRVRYLNYDWSLNEQQG
ncbi:MAG: DUF547 domain-containing protein [Chitinivibrionales bacterium]|nr:DUF547 domain-containing protein [Chitinivibrionales bacterium]